MCGLLRVSKNIMKILNSMNINFVPIKIRNDKWELLSDNEVSLYYIHLPFLVNRRGGNDSFGGSSFERIKIQMLGIVNAVKRVNY